MVNDRAGGSGRSKSSRADSDESRFRMPDLSNLPRPEWNRNTALLTGIGAAAAAGIGYLVARSWRQNGDHDRPAAAFTGTRPPGPVGDSGAARTAGTAEMRDPPKNWSKTDEALDESFPASDPPTAKHID